MIVANQSFSLASGQVLLGHTDQLYALGDLKANIWSLQFMFQETISSFLQKLCTVLIFDGIDKFGIHVDTSVAAILKAWCVLIILLLRRYRLQHVLPLIIIRVSILRIDFHWLFLGSCLSPHFLTRYASALDDALFPDPLDRPLFCLHMRF